MRLALLRHLFAIAVLPFTVMALVPLWILRRYPVNPWADYGLFDLLLQIAGLAVLSVGQGFFWASLRRFAEEGEGTLAPWDPPRRLVVNGPYRYVRNPMISGVTLTLFGQVLLLLSPPLLAWASAFLAINSVYIPLVEEPQLERRFGESYREYRRHVPRVIPRLRPWTPP
jgi:protein-S-isoprenylcysteine O-methyltransferase Ste14